MVISPYVFAHVELVQGLLQVLLGGHCGLLLGTHFDPSLQGRHNSSSAAHARQTSPKLLQACGGAGMEACARQCHSASIAIQCRNQPRAKGPRKTFESRRGRGSGKACLLLHAALELFLFFVCGFLFTIVREEERCVSRSAAMRTSRGALARIGHLPYGTQQGRYRLTVRLVPISVRKMRIAYYTISYRTVPCYVSHSRAHLMTSAASTHHMPRQCEQPTGSCREACTHIR